MSKLKTGVIDVADYQGETKSGWGKYGIFFEGDDEEYEIVVPEDMNDRIQLSQGMEINASKGKFDNYILHTTDFDEDGKLKAKSSSSGGSRRGGTRRSSSNNDVAESRRSRRSADVQEEQSTKRRGTSSRRSATVEEEEDHLSTVNGKIEMQSWAKICADVQCAIITAGSDLDPNVIVDEIYDKALEVCKLLND